jgi:hypothetical protein
MPDETVDGRLDALEARVTRVEAMTGVVTAVRADVATIAEDVDPALAGHVAELADTVENHGLLLARLLDNEVAVRHGHLPPLGVLGHPAQLGRRRLIPRRRTTQSSIGPTNALVPPDASVSAGARVASELVRPRVPIAGRLLPSIVYRSGSNG